MAVTKLSNSGIKTGVLKYDSMLAGNAAFDPAATWLIQRITATGGESSISFTNIPSTYQHLQIRAMARGTDGGTSGTSWGLKFNNSSGSTYSIHRLSGNGSSALVDGFASQTYTDSIWIPYDGVTANIFGVAIIDIHDYASSTKNKTVRVLTGVDTNGGGLIRMSSGGYFATTAVSSIQILPSATIKAGSTFALYGFKGV